MAIHERQSTAGTPLKVSPAKRSTCCDARTQLSALSGSCESCGVEGAVDDGGRDVGESEVVASRIDVRLSRHEFFDLERFMVPYRSPPDSSAILGTDAPAWSDLWMIRPGTYQFAVHENVPSGDIAVHRGMAVFDAEGQRAGWVKGWNFHPETGQLASLAFTAHALMHRQCIVVDASSVALINADGVRLTLGAADLHDLQPEPKSSRG